MHEHPAAPSLPNHIFSKGDLDLTRLKLLLLLLELDFIRKAVKGAQVVPGNDDCS